MAQAAVDRLRQHNPGTRSSASSLVVSSVTARGLLEELADGPVKDRLAAVTPSVRSSEASAVFSTELAKEILAELE